MNSERYVWHSAHSMFCLYCLFWKFATPSGLCPFHYCSAGRRNGEQRFRMLRNAMNNGICHASRLSILPVTPYYGIYIVIRENMPKKEETEYTCLRFSGLSHAYQKTRRTARRRHVVHIFWLPHWAAATPGFVVRSHLLHACRHVRMNASIIEWNAHQWLCFVHRKRH